MRIFTATIISLEMLPFCKRLIEIRICNVSRIPVFRHGNYRPDSLARLYLVNGQHPPGPNTEERKMAEADLPGIFGKKRRD